MVDYSNLKQMWEEMDHYLTFRGRLKCQEDIVAYAKHVEEFHIYELLTGLHPNFEQVRKNIIGKEPPPYLNEVYAY